MPYQDQCPECGLMHPPVARGECTVAKGRQLDQSVGDLGNAKAVRLMQAIQIKLLNSLKQLPPEKQDELSQMVFLLIEKYEKG